MENSTYTYTTYEVVAAPKGSEFQEFDCKFCAYHSLTKPVFLKSAEGTIVAAGAGCAALIMYGYKSDHAKVTRLFDIANHEAQQAEIARTERKTNATLALEALKANIGYTPELQGMRATFHQINTDMNFPDFLTYVATYGELN